MAKRKKTAHMSASRSFKTFDVSTNKKVNQRFNVPRKVRYSELYKQMPMQDMDRMLIPVLQEWKVKIKCSTCHAKTTSWSAIYFFTPQKIDRLALSLTKLQIVTPRFCLKTDGLSAPQASNNLGKRAKLRIRQ